MQQKFSILAALTAAAAVTMPLNAETTVEGLNPTSVEVTFDGDSTSLLIDFYGPNVFRMFQDPRGGIVRDPQATPPARILVDTPRLTPGKVEVVAGTRGPAVSTDRVRIDFESDGKTFVVTDLLTGKPVVRSLEPVEYNAKSTTLKLAAHPDEWFYGGGVQNGRFSHKGKAIDIVNTNSWTDGGVASPTPFYWSTDGYGLMWHTFSPGTYDFGAGRDGVVSLTHQSPYLDVFMMVDPTPVALLNDFYQLTGKPVLLPKFGFYEGHLNAYNRDYWLETEEGGVLFEDGKRYRESQKDNGGIRESLNGELAGNYQFSARAVIDRYNAHDMPLGWVLPNDGYGAGYGQTSTLDGNIRNLSEFGDYARQHGVEIGLWTQSDLHPKEGIEPLLQRDIVKEVRDAGVRVLKTDVAWVGAGYSFGLNGVADVGHIMPYYGHNARPFIISLDGWAGTQRYAGIWTGDQTGGEWEYIRFHIPTYIGSGLSGQPNICSDMDGIFGGQQPVMNTRDFQWKTWTPMQLNMDGWGANPKYPHVFGGKYENIVRGYLKLKSELLPYAYTYAREAVDGKPLVRAMFLDYPNDYTHGVATKYQFLYGPDFLVAPIYQETRVREDGGDVRNGIYLPEGTWHDYFTGRAYTSDGTRVLNNFDTPLWKLPVFVRAGAIIPMVNPNNNPSQIEANRRIYEIWPALGKSELTQYDDDGTTEAYRNGEFATTKVTADLSAKGVLKIAVDHTRGTYVGMPETQTTLLRIPATAEPEEVIAYVGKKKVKCLKVNNADLLSSTQPSWTFNTAVNRLAAAGVDDAESMSQIWIQLPPVNRMEFSVGAQIKGYEFNPQAAEPASMAITAPEVPQVKLDSTDVQPYALNLRWAPMADAASVEILHDGMLYTNLGTAMGENTLLFEDLTPKTAYDFKVRAVNPAGASDWTDLTVTTADNPLEFAISGISATATAPDQPGFGISHLFDFEERGDIWHTDYKGGAVPFDITIDLGSFNTLERMDYLPRLDGGNGTIMEGTVQLSENGIDWSAPVAFTWERSGNTKTFGFDGQPLARYIRLHVSKAVGSFGSGREMFVFKVPGTPSFIPGDINKDGKIDENDLTSYTNYTGLRRGDGDFDYVSMGDVNRNGLLDAFDISVVATQLDGGIENPESADSIGGTIRLVPDKKAYAPGEEVSVKIVGTGLSGLNAFSMAIPYNPAAFEFVGIAADACAGMANLTYDRLHTNGDRVLYPTFVNVGDKPVVGGDATLATIKFIARKRGAFTPDSTLTVMVDRALRCK